MKKISFLFIGFCLFTNLSAQKIYRLGTSNVMETSLCGHLKMGSPEPKEGVIEVNSLYMTVSGKPVLPIMGELYFSRIHKDLWKNRILRVRACDINIISTYLFWNYHGEIEGQSEWENEKDLHGFIKLCQKHRLFVVPGLDPQSYGEVRNGGTPGWILQKEYLKDRSNDMVYQNYVKCYFA